MEKFNIPPTLTCVWTQERKETLLLLWMTVKGQIGGENTK